MRIQLKYDEALSNLAYNFNLRRCIKDGVDPAQRRERTSSQLKGVSWVERRGYLRADCMAAKKATPGRRSKMCATAAADLATAKVGRCRLNQ